MLSILISCIDNCFNFLLLSLSLTLSFLIIPPVTLLPSSECVASLLSLHWPLTRVFIVVIMSVSTSSVCFLVLTTTESKSYYLLMASAVMVSSVDAEWIMSYKLLDRSKLSFSQTCTCLTLTSVMFLECKSVLTLVQMSSIEVLQVSLLIFSSTLYYKLKFEYDLHN